MPTSHSVPHATERSPGHDRTEAERLDGLYERLRERLLDLSNRNPMLNARISPERRSRRMLQIVNVALEAVYLALKGEEPRALDLLPLAEPGEIPPDELSEAFTSAFEHARLTDDDYLETVTRLEAEGCDDDPAQGEAEEVLRLKLRTALGLPERPRRHEVDRAAHARGLAINPDAVLQLRDATPPEAVQLQTLRYADELEEVVDRIADSAGMALQETGMSTLFLAFGFLERPEADAHGLGKRFRAPLLLLPVRILTRREEGRRVVSIAAVAGLETNLSLQRLVERDVRRTLPEFDSSGAEEERATIGSYFEGVASAIEGLKGWRIRPWLVLGAFPLGRFQLYHDLNPANWPKTPSVHPLVRVILAGAEMSSAPGDFAPAADYDIDSSDIAAHVPHLIADADSSQHSAIIDAACGKNLVIEGPPGTGKSQTITNIIAHAIGQGKKVLFLSEKQAALDVVRRRLVAAGLGPFALELHSEAAVPKAVIEALRSRADLGWGKPHSGTRSIDPGLAEARQTIAQYLDRLHEPQPDGETPFRLIWQSIRGAREQAQVVAALKHLAPSGGWLDDPAEMQAVKDVVEIYALAASEFEARHGPLGASPWSRTALNDVPAYDFLRVRAALADWRAPMLEAVAEIRAGADFGLRTLADLARFVDLEADLGEVRGERHLHAFADFDLAAASDVLTLLTRIAELEGKMATTPDLVLSPRVATGRAAELVASRFGEAVASRIPLDLNRAIRARVTEAEELIAAITGLMPALDLIGIDRDRPGDAFGEIALLARALAAMPVARRTAMLAYRNVKPGDLAVIAARKADLMEALGDWQRHFPGLDPADLPEVVDIRRAASWLRRGGVARLLSGMGAEAKQASALIARLAGNRAQAATPDAGLMDQLADFIAYCEAFRDDPAFRRLVGADWQGLATPVEAIATSIELRRALVQAMTQATGDAEVVELAFGLAPGGVATLIGLAPAAERFLALPVEMRARLKSFTLQSSVAYLDAEIRAAAALGDLAGDPMLMSLERPLGVIADYHAARETVATLRRDLAALPDATAIMHRIENGTPQAASEAVAWIAEVRGSGLPDEAKAALVGPRASEIRGLMASIAVKARGTLARLNASAAAAESAFGWFNLDAGDPQDLIAQINALIAEHGQLGDFLALRRLKLDLATDGLGPFLDTAERLGVPMATVPALFETVVARVRAEASLRATSLAQATGIEMDVRRRIFAERDRQRLADDQTAIARRLTELPDLRPIPGNNIGPKSTWTDLALLNSEFAKSARHLPIRMLLARAGRSIQALMPCFMVSPLSLAKFVPPGKLSFDLVVIDEASQMRPEDAIGALLRGTQVVVVGDPKQLPPSDFFRRGDPDRVLEPDDDTMDAESILEICARSFNAVRRLKWHYRSRCESLIAFSNREFYRDGLITFPNSRPEAFSIDLIRVNGLYRNRRNPDEAARAAEEAVRFMRHFAEAERPPTFGIATLNLEQRDLIREELRRIAAGDELVTAYMAGVAERGEPVFVKNLENLQGDERDILLVSLVRGPVTSGGPVAQTFGPIAGRHGGRRLNVLFTRARQRIAIFASFGSVDVHPSETSPMGVHVLKRYLQFVEERGRAPAISQREEPDSDFEEEVAERLRAAGFEVALQVGVSHYRIDLGVRHPDRPGTFLAGIECDGARYHSSKSARDRDRLREEVLAGLGWKLLRVWSTDWFADPEQETHRLVRRLDLLRILPDRAGMEYRFGSAEDLTPREVVADTGALERVDAAVRAADVGAPQLTGQLTFDLDGFEQETESGLSVVDTVADPSGATADVPGIDTKSSVDTASMAATPYGGLEEAASVYDAGPPGSDPFLSHITTTDGDNWSMERLTDALVALRDAERPAQSGGRTAARSILRASLIEAFVNEHVVEPGEWTLKIPRYLRLGTDAAELRYLDRICELVARLG